MEYNISKTMAEDNCVNVRNLSPSAINKQTQAITLPVYPEADINTSNYGDDLDSRKAAMKGLKCKSPLIITEDEIEFLTTTLYHFKNGDALYYAGTKFIITDAIAKEFCNKVKQYIEEQCWYTFPEQLGRKPSGIKINLSDPMKQMIPIFRRLLVCCDISKQRVNIDDVLSILNINLPKEYPLALFVHYVTCEDNGCNIGSTFRSNQYFIKGFQTWKEETEFISTKSECLDDTHNPIRSLNDSALLEQITTRTRDYREAAETNDVFQQINECMSRLSSHILDETNLPDHDIKLVGSSAEGTRAYLPDEFDFLIIIKNPNACDCKLGKAPCENSIDLVFICSKCQQNLEMICEALSTFYLGKIEKKNLYSGSNLNDSTKFFTLQFNWFGTRFKHLHIKIDLVPVLQGAKRTLLTPSIIYNVIDHSLDEVERIRNLPDNVRNGYTLAKAVRLCKIFNPTIINSGISDICDKVKSYHLKTCLLYITQSPNHNSLQYSAADWAIEIYEKFVTDFIGGKIVSFFAPHEPLRQFARDRGHVCEDDVYVLNIIGRAIQILSTKSVERVPIVRKDFVNLVERCFVKREKLHINHLKQTICNE